MSEPTPSLSENWLAAEEAVAALVRKVPGIKSVHTFTDYEQALQGLTGDTPAAFVYYDGDDPVRTDVDRTGSSVAVQNIVVGLVHRIAGNEHDGASHRAEVGPILANLRRMLPGQKVVPRAYPLSLHQGPIRRRLKGGVVYLFILKLSAPIAPVATPF